MCSMLPSAFATALADFSLNLYQQIGSKNNESNIFMSPLSISFALAMTYAGAQGDTKSQMKKVLFGDNMSNKADEEVHSLYAEVMGSLNKGDSNYKLHLANRVYAHQPFLADLLSEFTNILKEKYKSELQAVNFDGENLEKVRKVINTYVTEKTNQKINDLIPSGVLTPLTRLVLVNAIYFKGDWKTKFKASKTRKKTFFSTASKKKKVDMMKIAKGNFFLDVTKEYQILGLPYIGDDLFMFILLPKEQFGLGAIEEQLTGQKLLLAILEAKLQGETEVDRVSIPKFKLEETANLVEVLEKLGAPDMFDADKADLSNINGQKDLYISAVIHKAFIEVNEEGTEAAAATAVVENLRCAMPMSRLRFFADHPFLFTIVDVKSDNILFLGRFTG